jgi:hypothetical protein
MVHQRRRIMARATRLLALAIAAAAAGLALPAPARADVAVYKVDIGLPNTVAIMVRGQFTGNEILRFKAAIAEIDPNKRIIAILDSPGGSVAQGEALGRFFYDARIPTMVLAGTTCSSACTYAFFGGRSPTNGNPLRILASGARLGFHRAAITNVPKKSYTKAELEEVSRQTQQVVYRSLQHLIHVKAPLEVLQLNTGTRNDQINYITEGDALSYGITVLDRQSGSLVLPDNIERRTRRE